MTEKIISGVFILITYKNKKHHEDFLPLRIPVRK